MVYHIGLNGSQILRAGPLYLVNYNDISTAAVDWRERELAGAKAVGSETDRHSHYYTADNILPVKLLSSPCTRNMSPYLRYI